MECIFCKIAKKEIKSHIVYEDENFLAILDVNPRSTGMTLVLPKTHIQSLEENAEISKGLFETSIKISKAIKKALSPLAISIAYLPSKIEHVHLRIYPYYENELPIIENKIKETSKDELEKIKEMIKNSLEYEIKKEKQPDNIEDKIEKVIDRIESSTKIEDQEKGLSRRKRDWIIA
ncbi:MAG: HIT family protein [Candidatus Aenigmatarchaeota archaeon]